MALILGENNIYIDGAGVEHSELYLAIDKIVIHKRKKIMEIHLFAYSTSQNADGGRDPVKEEIIILESVEFTDHITATGNLYSAAYTYVTTHVDKILGIETKSWTSDE